MRILYLADIRFPLERANGIQTMETCHALARRAHLVHLIVRADTHDPARDPYVFYGLPRVDSLSIEPAPLGGPSFGRRLGYLAFSLGRAIGAGRPDVIFSRDLGVAALALRIPRRLRPPVVYESHGFAPDVAAALPDLLGAATPPTAAKLRRLGAREALVWREASGYVTITQALAADLEGRFGARQRLAVIPDGARIALYETTAPRFASERPLVVYAGHLYPWKGVDMLLEALAAVPEVDGLIAGGHPQETDLTRVKALADRLGLGPRLTFRGQLNPPDVPEILSRASVLVLPNPASALSSRFTSPLKLFEYMAAGRPIVAADLPAIREILIPDQHAVLVAPGSAAALAAGIRRVIGDPALAARLSHAARVAVADYSWDRRAERIEVLLDAVMSAPS